MGTSGYPWGTVYAVLCGGIARRSGVASLGKGSGPCHLEPKEAPQDIKGRPPTGTSAQVPRQNSADQVLVSATSR